VIHKKGFPILTSIFSTYVEPIINLYISASLIVKIVPMFMTHTYLYNALVEPALVEPVVHALILETTTYNNFQCFVND